jgi:hypothetical protein
VISRDDMMVPILTASPSFDPGSCIRVPRFAARRGSSRIRYPPYESRRPRPASASAARERATVCAVP